MNLLHSFKKIDTFIFDIDGVFTNGNILVLENGEMARVMNVKDGYAVALAVEKGYRVLVTSGSAPNASEARLNNLGVKQVYFRVKDKKAFVQKLIDEQGLHADCILYMGDDVPDVPVFSTVAIGCCPADAVPEVKEAAAYISARTGGNGCVRDVIEKVLKLRGDWDGLTLTPSA